MKSFKPKTPSLRQTTVVDYKKVLTRGEPEKSLTHGFRRSVGRNNRGRITTRHKGGGVKRLYRDVDFIMDKKKIQARIVSIENNPNKRAFLFLFSFFYRVKK